MNIMELYSIVKIIFDTTKGTIDLARKMRELTKDRGDLLGSINQNQTAVVSTALHRLRQKKAPRIAVVGETSTGKSALVNALFGAPLTKVSLVADTTKSILRVEFESGLVIYDTPGIFGKERLENLTRLFIGLRQDHDKADQVKYVPFHPDPESEEIIQLSGRDIGKHAPIDVVLWTINVSRPLSRIMRKVLHSFFSELEKKFGDRLVVAGTHLDRLNEVSDEEKEGQLRVWNEISNNQIVPVSSVTGDGLVDLATELFKRMPGNVSLSKLQESLEKIAKIDRLSFVVAEVSRPLAIMMLMSGEDQEGIEIYVIILISTLCYHYSVNEETWLDLHGDGLEIARYIQETSGTEQVTTEREPIGLWEKIKSWFGATFYTRRKEYRTLGVEGLSELLPIFYELIYEFENFETSALPPERISQRVLSERKNLEPSLRAEDIEKLASRINDLLKSLLPL